MKFFVDQIATPRLADKGSRQLPDSLIQGVGNSPTHRYGESATPRLTDSPMHEERRRRRFFWIETNILVPQLSKGRRITNLFRS